jgi:hypothetical protein
MGVGCSSPCLFSEGESTYELIRTKEEGLGPLKVITQLGVVVHAYNPSTWEAEAGGSLGQGQPGLHNKTKSQTKNNKKTGDHPDSWDYTQTN